MGGSVVFVFGPLLKSKAVLFGSRDFVQGQTCFSLFGGADQCPDILRWGDEGITDGAIKFFWTEQAGAEKYQKKDADNVAKNSEYGFHNVSKVLRR